MCDMFSAFSKQKRFVPSSKTRSSVRERRWSSAAPLGDRWKFASMGTWWWHRESRVQRNIPNAWRCNLGSAPHSRTDNFPVSNDLTLGDLSEQLQYIYENQNSAFRLNFSAGLILQNTETGRYRFFRDHQTSSIFDRPLRIHNRAAVDHVKLWWGRSTSRTTYCARGMTPNRCRIY